MERGVYKKKETFFFKYLELAELSLAAADPHRGCMTGSYNNVVASVSVAKIRYSNYWM